jgi:hypothetical protein
MISGEPIRTGGDGRGPLSSHGVQTIPVGTAYVYGSERPDLFTRGDRWYPGAYLYRYVEDIDSVPVFDDPRNITIPQAKALQPAGTVFQTHDTIIHGFWLDEYEIIHTLFHRAQMTFIEEGRIRIEGMPSPPGSIGVWIHDGQGIGSGVEVLLSVCVGTSYRPKDQHYRDSDYRPFDGAGIWRGGLPKAGLYTAKIGPSMRGSITPRLLSTSASEVHGGHYALSPVRTESTGRGIVGGSRFGVFHVYEVTKSADSIHDALPAGPLKRRELVDTNGIILRHPACKPSPIGYPNSNGEVSDLIAGGECSLFYYRHANDTPPAERPMYHSPAPLLEADAELYGGSLPVPNVVDWDGDGLPDIVAGNSEGRILFFRNVGSVTDPSFLPGVSLEAGGEEIFIQPGYRDNVQGPGEARWGYTCPTVVDWNYDGVLDIVMSDATGRHTVFMNRGTPTEAKLDRGRPIYLDGLELHGTWRVKPAVHDIDGSMAYITLDDEDELHLYWRIDDYNLGEGEKLRLSDGSAIKANFLEAGGTGRLKINLVDWDGDGLLDLLIGTPRHGSVPNPKYGLPQSMGLPGSAVLFLKNVGSNLQPVYEFPRLMHHRGEPIFLGQHSCGPAPAFLRPGHPPDLIVGRENGLLYYYSRSELSTE